MIIKELAASLHPWDLTDEDEGGFSPGHFNGSMLFHHLSLVAAGKGRPCGEPSCGAPSHPREV